MKVLITGGAGFIGSNFIYYMLKNYQDIYIVNLDLLTYAGNLDNLSRIKDYKNYTFIKGDIVNNELVEYIIKSYGIDIIVNFAAESHVDKSIKHSDQFIRTNVLGTLSLLNVAKENNIKKFIQVSTDEVYGSLGKIGYFTEQTPLAPNSPYSASKASADLIVRSYHETFGLHVNITRCSNNYGPFQFPEKLIPLMITNAIEGKLLPVYGDGKNIRDWLHVEDHCSAIDLVLQKGKPGEVYNIGGNNERTNIEVVEKIVDELGVSRNMISFVDDRLGHDFRYAIDSEKIRTKLGWKGKYSFDSGLEETINWYKSNQKWWKSLKIKQ
ncbi:dTDP-glucose 4,6-dehydratase [Bacillus suaedaesalsae]|uniref:dTDP-glucose 4,6-dehydratase n=1 Tax=Bacillus suaedaesalsae TaxID=2810349 RepID=A0ABS2DIG4_9BACI|nr:dTDP-glucose 4,6-dehydratase [Bacillus suaedaesalsae]